MVEHKKKKKKKIVVYEKRVTKKKRVNSMVRVLCYEHKSYKFESCTRLYK